MDLKALREQAINEANNDFSEENINKFKQNIKNIIRQISDNNNIIAHTQKQNKKLQKQLEDYELEEFTKVSL